jgi:hypothetical protein
MAKRLVWEMSRVGRTLPSTSLSAGSVRPGFDLARDLCRMWCGRPRPRLAGITTSKLAEKLQMRALPWKIGPLGPS